MRVVCMCHSLTLEVMIAQAERERGEIRALFVVDYGSNRKVDETAMTTAVPKLVSCVLSKLLPPPSP